MVVKVGQARHEDRTINQLIKEAVLRCYCFFRFRFTSTFRKVYKELLVYLFIMSTYWINFWRKRGLKARSQFRKNSKRPKTVQTLGSIIGDKCKICRSRKNIRYHEIHGNKHEHSVDYILKHTKDFVPLCQKCHTYLHMVKIVEKLPEIRLRRLVRLLSFLK